MRRQVDISYLITEGLERVRDEGVRLGRPRISIETEERIVRLRSEGMGVKATARAIGVGVGTVQRYAPTRGQP